MSVWTFPFGHDTQLQSGLEVGFQPEKVPKNFSNRYCLTRIGLLAGFQAGFHRAPGMPELVYHQ
ncbi:MAG TPA: hypothetical protein VJN01_10255, partial [Xanthomonadales bacterium]|nr:hypothetical protein [Xanthomonadales bacterium]